MNQTIQKLLAVQEHDLRLRNIDQEMKDVPARKRMRAETLHEHREQVAQAETKLKEQQTAVKNIELEIETRKGAAAKLKTQQFQLRTNEEFRAMQGEIQNVENEISRMEDRELQSMDGVEALRAELEETRKALQEEEAAVEAEAKELDARHAALATEKERLLPQREQAAAEVDDPEWLARYERVFARKDKAVVALDNGVCSGCQMQVPPQTVHDAVKQDRIVSCNFCGRLLY